MKSYVLAIALAMLVAAGFVFQNPGIVTVHFLIWTRELPQGVWEVVLFAAGGILMWGVSLVAMMETRNKSRREIRTRDRRIQELQEERDSLVSALNSFGSSPEKQIQGEAVRSGEDAMSVSAEETESRTSGGGDSGYGKWDDAGAPEDTDFFKDSGKPAGNEEGPGDVRELKQEGDQDLF